MRTTLIGMSVLVALAGTALADGYEDPKSFAAPPVQPWNGVYLGVGVGYGHSTSKNDYYETDGVDVITSSFDGEGMHGGLVKFYGGYDRQVHSRFVLGVFADVDWTDLKLTYSETDTVAGIDVNDELEIEWQWAVGARAGYLFTPQTLLYFTGGFTQAHFKSDGWYDIYPVGTVVLPGKSSVTYNGYFVGFGMETLIGHGLALRGEMRYSEFDGQVVNSGVFAGDTFIDKEDPTLLAGWIGLSYKFGHRDEMAPIK